MTTTSKNFNYYFNIFLSPCYMMRKKLEEEYQIIASGGFCTIEYLSMVADHLTSYNELACVPTFFKIRDFETII